MQRMEIIMRDGDQSPTAQTFYLVAIVHNVAKTIKPVGRVEFLLGLAYGRHNTVAESGGLINLNPHRFAAKIRL